MTSVLLAMAFRMTAPNDQMECLSNRLLSNASAADPCLLPTLHFLHMSFA